MSVEVVVVCHLHVTAISGASNPPIEEEVTSC